MPAFFLTTILLIICSATVQARIIHVPGDSTTIQGGINGASAGDTVLVADGTYTGDGNRDIDFLGTAIVLMSENGPDVTIIDCEGSETEPHRGFYFHMGEDLRSVLQGFSITGGLVSGRFWPQSAGGAILCDSSSPTITGNKIYDNKALSDYYESHGGGIACGNGSGPLIKDNQIFNNTASNDGGGLFCEFSSNTIIENNDFLWNESFYDGGGICCYNSSPYISGNKIINNMALIAGGIFCSNSSSDILNNRIEENNAEYGGGIYCTQHSSPRISGNIIVGNTADSGGGIIIYYSSPVISNCTIYGNLATGWGGGGLRAFHYSSPVLTNTIFWGNSASFAKEIYIHDSYWPSSLTISFSDVEGGTTSVFVEEGCTLYWGDGMIDANPMSRSYKGFDYLLHPRSPCVDAGDPSIEDDMYDWHPKWPDWYPNSSRSDMGAYGGPDNVGWLK
jgi:parallel beta-helix repeat protein